MAYEVTKEIKGHEYRYVVESYLDEKTNRKKTRWHYLGPVEDGLIRQEPKRRHKRVTREEILSATARLLDFRDPDHITVGVIANAAGISHTTFYRYFQNPQEALNAAVAQVCDESVLKLPSLELNVTDIKEARVLLRSWCEALYNMVGHLRAFQRMISQRTTKPHAELYFRSLVKNEPSTMLAGFLETLCRKELCEIDDVEAMARTVVGLYVGVQLTPALASRNAHLQMPGFGDVYHVIDRAIFGS